MAIAPLDLEEVAPGVCSPLELPWPKPVLRIMEAEPAEAGPPGDGEDDPDDDALPAAYLGCASGSSRRMPESQVHRGVEVEIRRHRRATLRRRRRVVLLGAATVLLVTGLALPSSIVGGQPLSAKAAAAVTGQRVYVVQPGDTVWSIARRLDGAGDPRALAEAIERETGSSTVAAGERIPVP